MDTSIDQLENKLATVLSDGIEGRFDVVYRTTVVEGARIWAVMVTDVDSGEIVVGGNSDTPERAADSALGGINDDWATHWGYTFA